MADLDSFRRTNKGGENDGVYAEFFTAAVQMGKASEDAGRPIFEDREMVRIVLAGDNKTEMAREATPRDKERFARQYAAFKAQQDQLSASGTPLSQWPAMTPALVRNFAGLNIFTVEQLAALPDSGIQAAGMGAREWAAKAKAYMEQAADSSTATRLAGQNDRLLAENADLRRQVQALSDQLARRAEAEHEADGDVAMPLEQPKRGPGRPPKAAPMPTVLG